MFQNKIGGGPVDGNVTMLTYLRRHHQGVFLDASVEASQNLSRTFPLNPTIMDFLDQPPVGNTMDFLDHKEVRNSEIPLAFSASVENSSERRILAGHGS